MQWAKQLTDYEFQIQYKKDKENLKPDILN